MNTEELEKIKEEFTEQLFTNGWCLTHAERDFDIFENETLKLSINVEWVRE